MTSWTCLDQSTPCIPVKAAQLMAELYQIESNLKLHFDKAREKEALMKIRRDPKAFYKYARKLNRPPLQLVLE
jgi:hypothetical protein